MHTRRDFLRAALGASAFLSLGPAARRVSAGSAQSSDRNTVLVVVQLTGGNDGLNTVVPYGDDEYGRNRTTLRLPTSELHKIDSLLALHPRMSAFRRLYQEGQLSIVQGVGHAGSDRDHDRAMRIWHTAQPDRAGCQTGWLGRLADSLWSETRTALSTVFVGPISRPFALNAENVVVPCIRSAGDLTMRSMAGRTGGFETRPYPGEANNALLGFLRDSTRDARAKSERIEAVVRSAAGTVEYPPFGLAGHLRTVAQLIRANLGIRVFFTELGGGGIGGFDNHANQLGNHCALLHQLAESTAAFVDDLNCDKTLDRVLLMTFSEFGRTVKENGRRGTDHGAAAPIFLAGGKVKGGLVGSHPSLADLDGGAQKFHTDFRRVYATVLDQWLGFPSEAVLGTSFPPLDILMA